MIKRKKERIRRLNNNIRTHKMGYLAPPIAE